MIHSARMPAIFVGHGNPMNALARNPYTEGWRSLGDSIPRPRAILCVSAHWYVPRSAVTAMARPRTIHDFGGFARELFQVEYAAPGLPELAQRVADLLAPLRDEGILILGSGNIVHNLHAYAWGDDSAKPYDWALRFDARARELLTRDELGPLVDYESMGRDALLSAPTPDHYLPLLYVIAQRQQHEPVSFPVQGFDGGSISMLCVRIG
jgi:4,5-DOPA dioxygenase extradiol